MLGGVPTTERNSFIGREAELKQLSSWLEAELRPLTIVGPPGAGKTRLVDVSADWNDPKLWWPDSPQLYVLRTTLVVDDDPVDIQETTFGFREWRVEGTKFTLNGVVWHMWADLVGVGSSPQAFLEAYRRTNQRTTRISTAGQAARDSRLYAPIVYTGCEADDS